MIRVKSLHIHPVKSCRGISLEIASVVFRVSKPCVRSIIVNTDQHDGTRTSEPLSTLAEYRTLGGKVLFCQNLVHRNSGVLRVGDSARASDQS